MTEIIQRALDKKQQWAEFNGIPINNIWYADDTILIVERIEYLQNLIEEVVTSSEESRLTLNIKKTKLSNKKTYVSTEN